MREERELRNLERLAKVMLVVMIILIVTEMFSCIHSNAAVIEGEKHLSGLSKVMEDTEYKVYPEGICLLAEVMYHENWHTDKDHLAAYYTGAVVMNRIKRDDKWLHLKGDKTVYDVVYAKGQYSTTNKFYTVELPDECYQMAIKVAKGTPDVPENVIYQAMFKQGSGVWKKVGTDYFCYE